MKKKIIITIILLVVPTLIILNKETKEEANKLSKIENMLSYTIDGKSTSEKITKTSGYIVKNITCDNNTNLVWDNTNWEVELIKLENKDNCIIDFTKEETTSMPQIKINTSLTEGIDSINKTTINGGTIKFYPKEGYSLTEVSGCKGKIENNTLIITNVTSQETCNVTLRKDKITLKEQLLADNPTILTRTDFDNVFTETNTGTLYKATGDITEGGKDVYYFAGNAQNNWVKFGKDQDGADLYWRIIRTNEDGGVRLLYIGPDKATTNAFIKIDGTYMSGGSNTTGMYNSTYNNTMYVGYMYGSTGSLANNRTNSTSAPIKTVTDNWYSKTINVKTDGTYIFDKYVSQTAIYCNDRSGDGYSASGQMSYASSKRMSNKKPSYKCGNNPSGVLYGDNSSADKFTKSTSTGNGKLTYGVAQITADEIAFAGGRYGTNAPAWYYYNSAGGSAVGSDYWWTMSPYYFFSSGRASVFFVRGSGNPGYLDYARVGDTGPGVRPVLSL